MSSKILTALGVAVLATCVSAQVADISPVDNIRFKLNIPESTASTGKGDIFFSLSAPSSYSWVALGQGQGMSGSNMFLMYTSSSGSNVTLSPRTASGHNTPTVNAKTEATLLEGSGVSNGVMTANVKCSNCNSWTGGTMDFTAGSGNWIYAYQPSGGPISSDDQSAPIRQHSDQAAFKWDFAKAKGGSSVNPFLTASGTAASTCIPRPASTASPASSSSDASATQQLGAGSENSNQNNQDSSNERPGRSSGGRPPARRQSLPYCDDVSSGGSSTGNQSNGFTAIAASGGGNRRKMLIAHGVLAALAFVILFPTGAIAIRLASFPGLVWAHAAFQGMAYLIYIAGFGLGVYLARDLRLLGHHHPIIGIVVLVLVSTQTLSGLVHHRQFKKQPGRTPWSHAHLWVGRIAITLGIINGGLGLRLADASRMSSRGGMVAYGVVAGLMWVVWVAAIVVGERKRAKKQVKYAQPLSEADPATSKP